MENGIASTSSCASTLAAQRSREFPDTMSRLGVRVALLLLFVLLVGCPDWSSGQPATERPAVGIGTTGAVVINSHSIAPTPAAPVSPADGGGNQGSDGGDDAASGSSPAPVTSDDTSSGDRADQQTTEHVTVVPSKVPNDRSLQSTMMSSTSPMMSSATVTKSRATTGFDASPPVVASGSLGAGAVAAIGVSLSLAAVLLVVVVVWYLSRRKKLRYSGYQMSNLARRNYDDTDGDDVVTYRNDGFGAWRAYDDL
eukprot:scpid91340/ scgid28678/ 